MTNRAVVTCVAAALLLAAVAREADAGARRSRPLKTGQITCWSTTQNAMVPCAGTDQDGALRRGEPRAYRDNGDGTIRDLRTALTWEKLSDDFTVHDKDWTYDWAQAFDKVDGLNTPPCFAGFCDWRLPNRFELETLLNLENLGPSVSPAFHTGCVASCTVLTCSCTQPSAYWSASSYAFNREDAWVVSSFAGDVAALPKTDSLHVRAVRGGS